MIILITKSDYVTTRMLYSKVPRAGHATIGLAQVAESALASVLFYYMISGLRRPIVHDNQFEFTMGLRKN
jgi:hypothetical protein